MIWHPQDEDYKEGWRVKIASLGQWWVCALLLSVPTGSVLAAAPNDQLTASPSPRPSVIPSPNASAGPKSSEPTPAASVTDTKAYIERSYGEGALRDALVSIVEQPSDANYRRAHATLIASPEYSPYGNDLDDLGKLYKAEKFAEVLANYKATARSFLLSPRLHIVVSISADLSGQSAVAGAEKLIGRQLMKAMLATGDGTEKKPILVSCVDDEYEAVKALRLSVNGHTSAAVGPIEVDILHSKQGDIYFDITASKAWLMNEMIKSRKK